MDKSLDIAFIVAIVASVVPAERLYRSDILKEVVSFEVRL